MMSNFGAFRTELIGLLNKHSLENGSNTPDFILADYLISCLSSFDTAVSDRSAWYGGADKIAKSDNLSTTPTPPTNEPD